MSRSVAINQLERETDELKEQIAPILEGRPGIVVATVLAEFLGLAFSQVPPDIRDKVRSRILEAVNEFERDYAEDEE